MRWIASTLLLALCACGDDATTPSDGDVADASVDGPPQPMCPDAPPVGAPADQTTPGAATLPSPTLRNLTVEWAITGDANLDATVTVRYRTAGGAWQLGAPLRRIPAGTDTTVMTFSWANRFSGSVFDLTPGTAYEVELALLDPDGGCEIRTLTASTRPVPAPMAGAPVVAVAPGNLSSALAAAAPGQILELSAATYPTFTLLRDGAPGMPIVIRAAAGATVNITGDVRLDSRHDVILDGLRIAGKIKFNSARDLAIVRNHVTTTEDGITTKLRSDNLYIADNTVVGATLWNEPALGASGTNIGEGIEVTGPGHVIEYNRVRGFRDCISLIEDGNAVEQHSIDISHNDLSECADDAIEADFCFHNCRITSNRMTNVFIAMSSQPGLGGPTWFIRNVAFNVLLSAFKLQRGSVGDVGLHNTIVKRGDAFGIYTTDVFSRQWFRNNLFLGGPGGTYNTYDIGSGRVMELRSAAPTFDSDYDGLGSTTGSFAGIVGTQAFTSIGMLRATTTEVHAVEINAAVFATPAVIPTSPFPAQVPPDLRPAAGGAAVDVGVALPGINGAAPDLGAYEAGDALPTYGPRP